MLFNIANAAHLEAARVAFHAAFLQELGLPGPDDNPLMRMFNELPSTANVEEWNWLGDLPDFEEWKGDRELADLEAFKLQIRNKDWSNGVRVHQNTIKDDKLGLVQPSIASLAKKAKTHRVRLMVKMLLNGFDGNAYPEVSSGLAYDGKFFFSTTHATGSNKLAVVLNKANLEAAELLLSSQTNYTGDEPLELRGTHLIVGPALEATANDLMNPPEGESQSLKNRYEVVVSPLLRGAYANYWFLVDLDEPVKPFIFQLREEISTSAVVGGQNTTNDSVPRFQRGELWFGAEARYNVGAFEFRLAVGSTGP